MSFVKCCWLEPLYKSEERGIIPITWIQDHGGHRVVRWPPGMVDVQQHIRRQTVPTEDWKVFVLIKILSIPGTESDCDITTTDTDDDNSTDRQPRRRKARLDDYMTIKEYDELVASLKKQGTKRKAAEPAPTCSGSVPPSPVPSPFRKSRPPKVLVPDIETLLEQVEKIDESEPEQHDAMQQIVTHTDCSNRVILQSLQNLHKKVDQLEEKLKRKLNSANFTLTKIEKDTCNGEKKVFSNEQPLLLKQCNTVEDIIELEQLLQDQQFEKRVMEILQTVGGSNMKKGIYRMLSRIMTIQCASLFNITGKEKSQKSNFKNLKINYAILESAKAVYKTYTDKDAESAVGAWLRQSGNTYTRNITRASQ